MEALDFSPVREHFNRIALQFSAYDLNDTLLRVDLLGMYTFDRLHELKNRTGIDPTDIPLNDEDTMALFRTADTEDVPEFGANVTRGILSLVKPDCLQDLIKISGLIHGTGTWHENAELLIKNGTATIKDVAAVRDYIYNTFQKLGMTREDAFNAMEAARIGRLYAGPDSRRDEEYTKRREDCVTMLRAHGVPDWYVDSLKKIRYMFPKAHAAEYALMGYRAAWYKVHFPLEYDAVRSEMQN